jgi:hypothetical protein
VAAKLLPSAYSQAISQPTTTTHLGAQRDHRLINNDPPKPGRQLGGCAEATQEGV